MDNQKIKWVTPKEIIGISELLTGYKYIDSLESEYNTAEDFYKALHYIQYLHETKLTPELVEKLFKGFERREERYEQSNGLTIDLTNKQLDLGLQFYYFDGELDSIALRVKDFIVLSNEYPLETLADLVRLTAAKPILLA
jgi:hypothetical protein